MNMHLSPETLAALHYKDLPAAEAESAAQHLQECDACRAQLDALGLTSQLLHTWQPAVTRTHSAPEVRRKLWPALTAAAACLTGGIFIGHAIAARSATSAATSEVSGADGVIASLQQHHDARLKQLVDRLSSRLDAGEERQREFLSKVMESYAVQMNARTDALQSEIRSLARAADQELSATRREVAATLQARPDTD